MMMPKLIARYYWFRGIALVDEKKSKQQFSEQRMKEKREYDRTLTIPRPESSLQHNRMRFEFFTVIRYGGRWSEISVVSHQSTEKYHIFVIFFAFLVCRFQQWTKKRREKRRRIRIESSAWLRWHETMSTNEMEPNGRQGNFENKTFV